MVICFYNGIMNDTLKKEFKLFMKPFMISENNKRIITDLSEYLIDSYQDNTITDNSENEYLDFSERKEHKLEGTSFIFKKTFKRKNKNDKIISGIRYSKLFLSGNAAKKGKEELNAINLLPFLIRLARNTIFEENHIYTRDIKYYGRDLAINTGDSQWENDSYFFDEFYNENRKFYDKLAGYTYLIEYDQNPARAWIITKKANKKQDYKLLIGLLNYVYFDKERFKTENLHFQSYDILDLNSIDILLLSIYAEVCSLSLIDVLINKKYNLLAF